ncbi:hypothetical protein Rhal01_03196 [Rubritalea halochordaticola]|uniref:Alpha-2-macroglobulin n=2 Tax=Rubritalea halochordaticola TaxID=714537 RepID=A0ABP9V370_9BACT
MKSMCCLYLLGWMGMFLLGGMSAVAGVAEDRAAEAKMRKDGNWKEALELNKKLVNEVSDSESGQDLKDAVECISRLGLWKEVDPLIDTADEKKNPLLWLAAGEVLLSANHNGMLIANEFERGGRQWRQGAQYANVNERDRVYAIQLFRRCEGKLEKKDDQLRQLRGLGQALMTYRGGGLSWKMQVKTDLDVLPEAQVGYQRNEGTGGAPQDEEGNPVFYQVPASFEAAKNDGERWRWTLMQRIKVDEKQKASADFEWAGFLHQQFGVSSLAGYSWFGRMPDEGSDKKAGVMQVHTLKDNETICKLAGSVKRFELPQDQNYIHLYKQLYEDGNIIAGDQLVRIYLDRRQYTKAKNLLEQLLAKKENKHRRNQLEQITGNWGQFDYVSRAFPAGQEPELNMVFRNAKEVKISVLQVKTDELYKAAWDYLESNPEQLDWSQVRIYNLLNELINGKQNKFIGETIAEQLYPLKPRENYWDVRTQLKIPVKHGGQYIIKAEMEGGTPFYTMLSVEEIVMVAKNVEGGKLVYVADGKDGSPVAGAKVEYFGYKQESLKKPKLKRKFQTLTKKVSAVTGEDGSVLVKGLESGYRWMSRISKGEHVVWSGAGAYYWYSHNRQRYDKVAAFGMTNQPVYKPESEVLGKFWVRQAKYDLGGRSVFAGKKFKVEVFDPLNEKFGSELTGKADEFGGVPFKLDVPADAKLGVYRVVVWIDGVHRGQTTFRVEQFKKPEYEVIVEAPKEAIQLGDKFEATVKAKYYHGAPVTKATVKVKVMRHDYNELWFPYGPWDWLYGRGYGWLDIERPWYSGWSEWGCRCPRPFWWPGAWSQPELVFERDMPIGKNGEVKVEIDSELAKLVHGDKDHRYDITAEVVDASRRTIFGNGSVLATRKPYQVSVWLDRGYAEVNQKVTASIAARTLDGKVVEAEGKAILYKVSYAKGGKANEEQVAEWEVQKHPEGTAKVELSIKDPGQYRLAAKLKDAKGREVEGGVLFTVRGGKGEGDYKYNDLELIADKRTYKVGDTVKLLVNTKQENSTVWLFIRDAEERKMLKLSGKSALVEIPVTEADMPNFFVEAVTVSDATVHESVRELIVPPAKRVLNIAVLPNEEKYKPRADGKVKVRVTGLDGEPVKGDVVLTVYDKALEYISGGSNVTGIKEFFWKWRRHFRGGFENSLSKGHGSMVKNGTSSMQFLGVFGYSLADDATNLDIPGIPKAAGKSVSNMATGGLRSGDYAVNRESIDAFLNNPSRDGSGGAVQLEEAAVDFGDGHDFGDGWGAGGAPEVQIRKDFEDAIHWSGSVELDENGVGEVDVKYPDNLTTWKIKAWAMGHGTRVGEGGAEVITSKDLIVRLQAPRFFIEKDEVVLSAVVHNYHKEKKDVSVLLELEGGTLKTEEELTHKLVLDADGGEQRVDWRVKVTGEGQAIVRMKVLAKDDSDAMEMTFPVYVHGMLKQEAWSRVIEPGQDKVAIEINVPAERKPEESKLEIRYSPTIAGAVVDALPYLVEYPYGCTEQTLNRFVPTVITQKLLKEMNVDLEAVRNKRANLNPQEIGDDQERAKQWKHWDRNPVFSQKEVDKMVKAGVRRLLEMQLSDGGWGWFSGYGEYSSPHTTAVVLHGLTIAKQNGAVIPEERIKLGVQWLKRYEDEETERIRMWQQRKVNTKQHADAMDAFVRFVLVENGVKNQEMTDYLFRDKNHLSIYAKSLLGMSLHLLKDGERRDEVIRNIDQYLVYDEENQSAYLDLRNTGYWWYWYGSEFEAHAWYLKLKSATAPKSKETRGLVKYLINNRKHASYWNSTRDTAYCIEAIADYMRASGENTPEAEIEVLFDGKVLKTVKITKENLFSYDNKVTLAGDILSDGRHTVEIRRKGKGPLYTNAYLTVFTKEDFLKKTGLEVKVERKYYKLVRDEKKEKVAGQHGQVVEQQEDKYERIPLKVGDTVQSGDIIEVELIMESKNDYEYLIFEDWKAAGLEAEEVRSGYLYEGLHAYMEVKDEKVCFFVRSLTRGRHNLSYRLRAEIPGKFSALPARAEAMYAPELKANSDEMKLEVKDK